jgi:dTDP-4-amino-4,6-dideoxygalactose transaminase
MPIVALGARPVLVDVDLDSQTIALDSLKHAFDKHPIRAVIQAHLFGRSTGAPEIKALCERNGAAYISDCAQLIGDKAITSMLSELGPTCYSFGDSKLLRIGEGGAVATNSAAVAERVRLARHEGEVWLRHGASRLVAEKTAIQDVICGLASVRLGLNFRPLAIAASLGRVVLRELAERLHQTRANAEALTEGLQGLDDLALPEAKERTWWTYPVLIRRDGIRRDVILAALLAEGIPVGVHFPRLLAHQPLIQRFAIFELSELQGAVEFSERHLVLPIYPPLTPAHMNVISTAFHKVLSSDQLRSKKAIQQAQQLLNDWPIDELCDGLFVFLK